MRENIQDDYFLVGSIVYLRKPNIQKDVIEGDWHSWFNDREITQYLVHGIFPVSREQEVRYVEDQLNDKSSLLLSIIHKGTLKHLGIVSLRFIDLINRTAEISIIMGFDKVPGAALEAMALLTEHAFERLNLLRLNAGQHEGLWKWVNSLELIGYKIEGYRKQAGLRNGSYDIVLTGITADDYYRLKKNRGGTILSDSIENLYKGRRKENLLPKVKDYFDKLHNE